MRRSSTILLCIAAALAVAFSGSATASNGLVFGQNVDPSLVTAIVASVSGHDNPSAGYHVMVFGEPGLQTPGGNGWRDQLTNVGAYSATLTGAQIAQLSHTNGVQYVAPDVAMAPTGTASSQSLSAAQLATVYPQVDGAPALWANGVTGAGVGIAVIDSGVTPRADFGSRLVQVQLPAQDGTQLDDSVGHGSVVSGVAAGQSPDGKYIGIAPGATVYAINVARSDGVYTSDVIAGLNWVLQNAKADNIGVVNLSLSEMAPSSYYTSTLDAAVDLLWKEGILVVVSSGNFGPNSEEFAPANDPWAITVGASDTNDTATTSDDSLAEFSSYGTTPDGFSKPEIVAPGRHIVGPIPGDSEIAQAAPDGHLVGSGRDNYVSISGTSFSAPQVTGAVALILQQGHSLSPDQVKWIVTSTERGLQGSDAGVLDLGGVAAALAHPDNANKGNRWSNWAQPGATTTDFLSVLGIGTALNDQLNATSKDALAQVSCLRASLTPAPKPVKSVLATLAALAFNAAYSDCAQKLDAAAEAWDTVANDWANAGRLGQAAAAEKNAASDWETASADWLKAANQSSSAADSANAAAAATQSAAWDSAAWDSAAWDSAAWDSAAWDSAAWDSAAWDSAAWDSAAWD